MNKITIRRPSCIEYFLRRRVYQFGEEQLDILAHVCMKGAEYNQAIWYRTSNSQSWPTCIQSRKEAVVILRAMRKRAKQ